jgi:hypothetical protein
VCDDFGLGRGRKGLGVLGGFEGWINDCAERLGNDEDDARMPFEQD